MKTIPFTLALVVSLSSQAQLPETKILASNLFGHEVLPFSAVSGAVLIGGPYVSVQSGGLDQPHGILHRSSGLLVASFGTHEVKRYDRVTGAFIDNFIPASAGLNAPVYLALGPHDGYLYVSSQGNDRVMRFDANTGAPVGTGTFVAQNLLDGPSGFGWSPDGTKFYVAGRYSANVLAYDATNGLSLNVGHRFATNLTVGTTFGLAVHRETGDVFLASGGDVLRFNPQGVLQATISIPGTAIGLELSPDGDSIYVASNNNLYIINATNNAVTGPFLSGVNLNTLNFFHFSRLYELQLSPLTFAPGEVIEGQSSFTVSYSFSKYATETRVTLQYSADLVNWNDAATYIPSETGATRDADTDSTAVGVATGMERVTVTERVTAANGQRFFRVQAAVRP
jgi:sugar lactone lactonase YvrE